MLVIALTGGIGCGKSTVARMFADCDAAIIDADQIARTVVEPGQPALEAIQQHFGNEVITASGELDRQALGQRVFTDPAKRHWLETLLHPQIRERLQSHLASVQAPYTVVEIQLLIEGLRRGMSYPYLDRIAVVDCSNDQQRERSLARGRMDAATIDAIIKQQATREQRLEYADDVIDNHSDRQKLEEQIKILDQKYRNPDH